MRRAALRLVLVLTLTAAGMAQTTDLSPRRWSDAPRRQAEQAEMTAPSPAAPREVVGTSGLVLSTLSPIAALAGVETMKRGGSAADAAVAVSLTQITTALGTNISFAGITEVVYYEARTRRTYALNAGWDAWSGERDRASIPLSATSPFAPPETSGGSVPAGRRTLVPGFMAGMEALHKRFGVLRFADLLGPAIGYADEGVTVTPWLHAYFDRFRPALAATAAGQRFMRQAGGTIPRTGERFVQKELAATLRAVAAHGAREMYSGQWAREFAAAVNAAGGHASMDDLRRYQVRWSEPVTTPFHGFGIASASDSIGAQAIRESLALVDHAGLAARFPYSRNAASLVDLSRILAWASAASSQPAMLQGLAAGGVDISPAGRLTPAYAKAVAPILGTLFLLPPAASPPPPSEHSASAVVVDATGNVAVLIHTSNTFAWGSTGLVVGGIPIPDAAGLTAARFPAVKPGDRIPHDMAPLIAFKGGEPVLPLAAIGASLVPESVRVIVALLAEGRDVRGVLSSPPLLLSTAQSPPGGGSPVLALQVPAGAYDADLIAQLRAQRINVKECSPAEVAALRGTAAVARVTGTRAESAEIPGIFNFVR